ncbi:MAG: hypothetical protein KAS13_04960 [Candidatus Omnitrophica bacterium]|nr:hypothetical protein [Candidatus Omnitrophota bacterium]
MSKFKSFILIIIIFLIFSSSLVFADSEQFKPSYQINKAKATIHYFFTNFERNPRLSKGVTSMLTKDGFELNYPWGVYKTKDDVDNWIKNIPNELRDAHHIQDIKVEIVDATKVKAVADVRWENSGPDNIHDKDHFSYVFELVDEGIGLMKVDSINCQRID